MWYLLTPVFVLLDLSATIISCLFINWWAPLFSDDKGYLPNWLAWIQTFDDTLDAGMRDGLYSKDNVYWARVCWLYRNPAYGFSYWALGCKFDATQWTIHDNVDGHFYATSTDGRFNLLLVAYGIKIKIGWKAYNMYSQFNQKWNTWPWGPEFRVPFVFSISLA